MSDDHSLPAVDAMGAIAAHLPKTGANAIVHQAFEEIGGLPALVEWGAKNQSEFYTKIWSKTIRREIDHRVERGIEDILGDIDNEDVIDAEFTVVEQPA